MRACRHCSHQNADHLAYCSQCGRRLAPITAAGGGGGGLRGGGGIAAMSPTAAMSRTMLATPPPTRPATSSPMTVAMRPQAGAAVFPANGAGGASRLGWAGDSIGYIYVYMRGKLDAGERRRRLIEERDGAQALLGGALRDLGATILRDGVQHPDVTGLLEAIGRAEARREAALGDIAASEKQKDTEEARLAALETALESEWRACDAASRDGEEILRTVTAEHQAASSRLARTRDERARLVREADVAAQLPDGRARAERFRHEAQALAAEQRGLEDQTARLDRQLRELRDKSVSLRGASAAARSKLDEAIATRRQAASAMAASIAGHVRERAEAERQVTELTEQLGRVAAQVRPAASSLLSVYQRIDRLQETIADRNSQIAALDQAAAHYDQRKLLTGVGLVTSMLLATVAAVWAALK